MGDAALAAADEADRRLAGGEPVGPLHGVPVSIKENVDGQPLGVQVIGPRSREDACLAAAGAIEAALGTVAPIEPRGA